MKQILERINIGGIEMTIAEIMKKMVALSEGNVHDINHFIYMGENDWRA